MRAIALLVLLASAAPSAGATVITVPMSGTIAGFNDPTNVLGGAVTIGETFSFTLTYENSVPDLDPGDPALGGYVLTSFAISGQVGGVPFQYYDGVANAVASVEDSPPFVGLDDFLVQTDVSFALIPGSFSASIDLFNNIGLAISNDSLTGIPFVGFAVLGGWPFAFFDIDLPNGGIDGWITGMNGVPEPATALLLAGGLGALAARRRARASSVA